MQKIFFFTLFLFFQISQAQQSLTETEKLATTAKVWGFLKYYHPNVASGKYDWDKELFTILPQVEKAKSKKEFSEVVENWITSLGEVKKVEPIILSSEIKYFDKNLNAAWLNNPHFFSKSLSEKLTFILENRLQSNHFYYRKGEPKPDAISYEFSNEIKYPEYDWKDRKFRLLALFRYWNYVEYFFPYKYLMDQNWDDVLYEMLPKFNTASTEVEYHLLMRELVIKLNDLHAFLGTKVMLEKFGRLQIPARVRIVDDQVLITQVFSDSLAKISDIRVGDIIIKVGGKTIPEILKESRRYLDGGNDVLRASNSWYHIFNGHTDSVKVEYNREGKVSEKYIYRHSAKLFRKTNKLLGQWELLDGNIGYVNLGEVYPEDINNIIAKLKSTKAIVFDLRLGAHDTNYILAEFLNPEPKEFAKFIDPDVTYPGRFIWRETEMCGKTNPDYYKGKVIVLVNENTQSHGEYSAMCLQSAPNATVIGSQTAGADGGVIRFEILEGFNTQFSGLGVFYPDGRETQRIGIVPDIEAKPTILGLREGKDEVLERAIQFIETGK
ncbi:C-terminal processing protease CtpA/Prc, contains a PDZ domain [Flavobacterium succinicans]|uniref:C-terminal processing protease CtpA/Prc, contains a PDZ domain n=1 Tax=Flavobacterium succinicans TaxID=29536 RepID=A0A1I4VWD0_9FLAO|nr:S41 family peptidase [Flavobacterium succinicans]SFN05561.1 C-terminal processing protease CtpA/Prc, contains a PDZ domain [Flavobacterium succinicans]